MKLLENVRGARTGDGAVAAAMALGKRLRKTTVLAGDAFGFIGNRMLEPYGRECLALLRHRDVGVADVDAALRDFGMAMGAFAESHLPRRGERHRGAAACAHDRVATMRPFRPRRLLRDVRPRGK